MVANTQADIWGRLIDSEKADLSPAAARAFLALGFKHGDGDRMNYLAARARADRLTDSQRVELQEYLRAGDLLALLKSKARQSLRRTAAARPHSGRTKRGVTAHGSGLEAGT